jgi:glycosyltransferase involved in cell wall biosynthesis
MMPDSTRLYYLDDIPTPYRLGVQKLVAEYWPGMFHIAYCAESEPGRKWKLNFEDLAPEFLTGVQFRPPKQTNPFSFKWNPGVHRSLAAFAPHVVILSGYSHPTMWFAARWCIANGVPYAIASETSCVSSSCSGWRWFIKRRVAAWMVRRMAFGLPVGQAAAEYLRHFGPTDAPMYFFPNTPDTRAIVAQARLAARRDCEVALRSDLGIAPDAQIFLFVGRLIEAKRPLEAVRAFQMAAHEANAVLVIVGDGELMPSIRLAAELDPRLILTGWVQDATVIARLMAIATAMILPSSHEPWGAVVNEAMAVGTPVIASDHVGAALELICDGQNGFMAHVGDIAGYADAIRKLLRDSELRDCVGRAAQRTAFENGEEFAARNLIDGAQQAAVPHR